MTPERFIELRGKCPIPHVIGEWLTECLDAIEELSKEMKIQKSTIVDLENEVQEAWYAGMGDDL